MNSPKSANATLSIVPSPYNVGSKYVKNSISIVPFVVLFVINGPHGCLVS